MRMTIEVDLESEKANNGGPTLERLALPEFDIFAHLQSHLKSLTFYVHGVPIVVTGVELREG